MNDDNIRPDHYGGEVDPFEARKVIRAWGLGFNLGNVLKYIQRAERKDTPLSNLLKARTYLDFEIGDRKLLEENRPGWVKTIGEDEVAFGVKMLIERLQTLGFTGNIELGVKEPGHPCRYKIERK
jgi:Protein of unknwon function (DUF3310)